MLGPPMKTETRKYNVPEGSLFTKLAVNNDGRIWIDAIIGKNGEHENSNSHALGAICGLAFRCGAHHREVIKYLKGITNEDSRVIGYKARSIPDALADALEQFFEGGTDGQE